MAELEGSRNTGPGGSVSGPENVLCRYFKNGVCRKGDNCRFSHDPNDKPSMICRYFLKGACNYGEKCRYEHQQPSYLVPQYFGSGPGSATSQDGLNLTTSIGSGIDAVTKSSQPSVIGTSMVTGNEPTTQPVPILSPSAIPHTSSASGVANAQEMIRLVDLHITNFVGMILDANNVPHDLPVVANGKRLSIEDARMSGLNLYKVIMNIGSAIFRCGNQPTHQALQELGQIIVNFWAEAKQPCPNLVFTVDDLAQVFLTPNGRQFLDLTSRQLQHLLVMLKAVLQI
ncbi:uncharacterized protein [Macrobrachium rosenbergii]|uniref:uncharacterized protein isoform X1 n=1 Tax=Macrobrachium rosenbergii TaxID=79674 RepID=UPI0034D5AA83